MTDLLAQQQSNGIFYEPYESAFKLCIHEEPNVQGRNERYEFRCDSHLSCCGRVCCVPSEAWTILGLPWWLFLLLLLLLLLLLAALAYLLYRLCCRKKRAGKEVVKRTTHTKRHATRPYQSNAGYGFIDRDDRGLIRHSDLEMPNGHAKVTEEHVNGFGRSPYRRSFHEEETFEEEFHEQIETEEKRSAMESPTRI